MNKTLKLGQINFINCLPVNLGIVDILNIANLDFNIETISTYPAEVNQLLRSGEIDLAPISSFEYISNIDKYRILDGISISSKIQADSVLVFADSYDSLLNTQEIFVTNKTASSVNLLKILLKEKFSRDINQIKFISFKTDSINYPVKLLIGDEALRESMKQNYNYVLDLGTAWYELTNLPMVFAVWAFNKSSPLVDKFTEINQLMIQARDLGFNQLYDRVLGSAREQTGFSDFQLNEYFNHLDYDLTARHKESMQLFNLYLKSIESFRYEHW